MIFAAAILAMLPQQDVSAYLRDRYARADCLVKRNGEEIEKILATRPQSVEQAMVWATAETPVRCYDGGPAKAPKIHDNVVRGALAEALLKRDFSAIGVRRGTRMVAIFQPLDVPANPMNGEARALAYLTVGECVAGAEPGLSFAVFGTKVAGPEEMQAVKALVPAISACLPDGLQLPIDPPVFRSFLAEAAYRVSVKLVTEKQS